MFKYKKIFLISILLSIITALLIIFSLENNEKDKLEVLTDSNLLVEKLNTNILMLRRNEKDFLARKDKNYILLFNTNYRIMQKNIELLIDKLNYSQINTDTLFEFDSSLSKYFFLFKEVSQTQLIIGLHENDALYLETRQAAHNLLELSKKEPKLLASILQLRRHEKDFMLRYNLKYRDKFSKEVEVFLLKNNDKIVKRLIKRYKMKFLELVEHQEEIGLNESLGLIGLMRKSIHETEDILLNLSKQLKKDIINQIEETKDFTYLSVIILMTIIIVLILFLIKFLTLDIKNEEINILKTELSKLNEELKEYKLHNKK